MSDKFQNIYRIPSARTLWWNYTQNGVYFITICTAHREHYLGEIVKTIDDGDYPGEMSHVETLHATSLPENKPEQKQKPLPKQQMQLSEIGKIAHQYWMEIPNHFPFVKLDAFVVMPNHVHGIVIIDKPDGETNVETLHATSLPKQNPKPNQNPNPEPLGMKNEFMASISPKKGELGTIIRSYKSAVTQQARQIHADFAWQTRFHEHIIRNKQSFHVIRKYIRNNPSTWDDDQLNSERTANAD